MSVADKRAKLNAAARRLFSRLCDADVEARGATFSLSRSDAELMDEFGDGLDEAIQWLNSKGLSTWFTADTFTLSDYGRSISDDPEEELGRLLTVTAARPPAAPVAVGDWQQAVTAAVPRVELADAPFGALEVGQYFRVRPARIALRHPAIVVARLAAGVVEAVDRT